MEKWTKNDSETDFTLIAFSLSPFCHSFVFPTLSLSCAAGWALPVQAALPAQPLPPLALPALLQALLHTRIPALVLHENPAPAMRPKTELKADECTLLCNCSKRPAG